MRISYNYLEIDMASFGGIGDLSHENIITSDLEHENV